RSGPCDCDLLARTRARGLRRRREGFTYRRSWRRRGIVPRKRVAASADLPLRRKLVYRMRYHIARSSHRMFRFARSLGMPRLYLFWARAVLRLYQSVTWSRGRLGKVLDIALPQPER